MLVKWKLPLLYFLTPYTPVVVVVVSHIFLIKDSGAPSVPGPISFTSSSVLPFHIISSCLLSPHLYLSIGSFFSFSSAVIFLVRIFSSCFPGCRCSFPATHQNPCTPSTRVVSMATRGQGNRLAKGAGGV